ncbi:MAG: PilZ domain-containing protein, partial [Alphaproteobacteria bacterium]
AIKGAVGSIGGITATFNEIDTLTRTIENAISEQNTATARIASAIALAASGSRDAEADVTEVSVSIDETNGEADQVRGSTDLLADVVEKLNVTVDAFLEDISKDVKERRSSTRRLSKDGILITAKGQRIPTKLADISDTGAKFECSGEMKEMDRFTLELEDGTAVRSTVIWVKNGFAGARFDRPMSAQQEAA